MVIPNFTSITCNQLHSAFITCCIYYNLLQYNCQIMMTESHVQASAINVVHSRRVIWGAYFMLDVSAAL